MRDNRHWVLCAKAWMIVACIGFTNAFAYDHGDFQFWGQCRLEYKLPRSWKIFTSEEIRLGQGAGDFYFNRVDIGVIYQANAWMEMRYSFEHFFIRKSEKWQTSYDPLADLILSVPLNNFKLRAHSKLERQMPQSGSPFWRLRNKMTLATLHTWTARCLQPFIAGEIYYDLHTALTPARRLSSGLDMRLNPWFFVSIYYLRHESRIEEGWRLYHVLATDIKMVL